MPRIYHSVNDVEKISDFGERLMALQARLEEVYKEDVMAHFEKISELTLTATRELIYSLKDERAGNDIAQKVLGLCGEIKSLAQNLKNEHIQRLTQGSEDVVLENILEDAINNLDSIRGHIQNIAQARLSGKLV